MHLPALLTPARLHLPAPPSACPPFPPARLPCFPPPSLLKAVGGSSVAAFVAARQAAPSTCALLDPSEGWADYSPLSARWVGGVPA